MCPHNRGSGPTGDQAPRGAGHDGNQTVCYTGYLLFLRARQPSGLGGSCYCNEFTVS